MASDGNGPNPLKFLGIGLELAGLVAVLAWIGHAIDQWLDSEPWGMAIGGLIGFTGGIYNLMKEVIKSQQR